MDLNPTSQFLSGNAAVALGALHAGVCRGVGYPGTPSTEILEEFDKLEGNAAWAPNEKVAAEVALGVAFSKGRALVTMKHVGLNVAADVLFTAAYSGVTGGSMVFAVADDPGMASSQNEQDTRRYAQAAGVPMLEPSDSQEAYDFTLLAFRLSEKWSIPIILRLTTRICHSATVVVPALAPLPQPRPVWVRDIPGRVMIPGHARKRHRILRGILNEVQSWNESDQNSLVVKGTSDLGIISSGVAYMHAREAAPEASFLKLSMTYPLPFHKIRSFVDSVERCVVVEENDPYLVENIRAQGIAVEENPEQFRFGELSVERVRELVYGLTPPEASLAQGKPPGLCQGCPHSKVFDTLKKLGCIVSGDIGCYTLGALPPYNAMDTQICMGASIGMGLGMRHVLPEDQARKVVSVIGDSTFIHSGLTGIAEMVYNPPPTGHLVIIMDNGTTAMTGLQEHPATGRKLNHSQTGKLLIEEVVKAMGVRNVHLLNPVRELEKLEELISKTLEGNELSVIVTRQPCLLAAPRIREYEREQSQPSSVVHISETKDVAVECACQDGNSNHPQK